MKLPLEVSIKELEENGALPLFDAGLNIAAGKHPGYSVVQKFGKNAVVNTTTLPEDVWDGSGLYTGFPIGAPEEFEAYSTSPNDNGKLVIQYLADETSEAYEIVEIQMDGTNMVASGITGIRMHTARYNSGDPIGFNKGVITVRHKQTTANVFCRMPIGRSQTACAAITVPAGHTGYVKRIFASLFHSGNVILSGGLWIRDKGESPRIRRPISFSAAGGFEENIFGAIPVLAGGDVAMRVVEFTQPATGMQITAGFDIIFIKN